MFKHSTNSKVLLKQHSSLSGEYIRTGSHEPMSTEKAPVLSIKFYP